MEARKSAPSLRIGVMSLKTIPFFGKSGTSRTPARNFSIISKPIAAMLTGGDERSTAAAQDCQHRRALLS